MMKKITLFMFVAMLFGAANAQTNFLIDYDGYDETEGATQGYSYERYIWNLNTNPAPAFSTFQWAIVDFDNLTVLENSATATGYQTLPTNGTYTITVDSVLVYYNYNPEKDTINDVTFSIYDFDDVNRSGQPTTRPAEVVNPVAGATPLYTESLDQNDLVISQQLETYMFYPNLSLAAGQNFSIFMNNVSDTLDAFSLLAGYNDDCGGAELGLSSEALYNSTFLMNMGATNGTIIPNYYTFGSGLTCASFYAQNILIIPFVTIVANDLYVEAESQQLVSETCPGSVTTLNANAFGGSGDYSYSWSPATGLSGTTGSEVLATVGEANQTYTLTVTDNVTNTVKTSTVIVRSFDVTVVAPGPQDLVLACGTSTNVNATATTEGTNVGLAISSISWSQNNSNPLQVSTEGQYIVTAVNNVGCVATDTVNVSITGSNAVDFIVGSTLCPAPAVSEIANNSERTAGWNFTWYVIQAGDTIGQPGGENFIFQFPTAGTYQVSLVGDSANCSFSRLRTVTVASGTVPPCFTSISDLTFGEYSVYPNPANSVLNVNFTLNSNEDVEISVISVDGKLIETSNFNNTAVVNTTINTASMNNGVYILKIKTENGVSTQKFVVSHQ